MNSFKLNSIEFNRKNFGSKQTYYPKQKTYVLIKDYSKNTFHKEELIEIYFEFNIGRDKPISTIFYTRVYYYFKQEILFMTTNKSEIDSKLNSIYILS